MRGNIQSIYPVISPSQEQFTSDETSISALHCMVISLRKHAFSNILKISSPKTESFHIKILIFFKLLLKT